MKFLTADQTSRTLNIRPLNTQGQECDPAYGVCLVQVTRAAAIDLTLNQVGYATLDERCNIAALVYDLTMSDLYPLGAPLPEELGNAVAGLSAVYHLGQQVKNAIEPRCRVLVPGSEGCRDTWAQWLVPFGLAFRIRRAAQGTAWEKSVCISQLDPSVTWGSITGQAPAPLAVPTAHGML
ncbi:MAG: hypothetical protein WCZ86_06235 [Desulfurivibrionaceae bacterium]